MKLALMFHLLGAVVWVGGMFFAYLALRPAAAEVLDGPQRLALWRGALARFFGWIWVSIAFVLVSGFYMVAAMGESGGVPPYVHIMLYIGVVMSFIYGYVYFSPFRALGEAVAARDWTRAAGALNQIRIAVAINLGLGLLNIIVATAGAI